MGARWALLIGAAAVATACDKDQPAAVEPPLPSVHVTVTAAPPVVVPGEAVEVTSEAKATNARLTAHGIIFSGLFDTTLSFPVVDPEAEIYVVSLHVPHLPIQGTLELTAFARAGDAVDSARGRLVVQDDGPPKASLAAPASRIPGDTLTLTFDASDAAGLKLVTITVTGGVQLRFAQAYDFAPSFNRSFQIPVPATARMGDSVHVVFTVTDGFDKETTVRQEVPIADLAQPAMTGTLTPTTHDYWTPFQPDYPTLFAGDTAQVTVRATDNYRLAWLGYRLGDQADSIHFETKTDSATFYLPVPAGKNGLATLYLFARDSSDNLNWIMPGVDLVDAARRPMTHLAPFPEWNGMWLGEFAYDQKRDVLYVIHGNSVSVLSLSPLAYQSAIPLPGQAASLDITAGGDSLVVLVGRNQDSLALLDLTQAPVQVRAFGLALGSLYGYRLRTTADNRALVTASTFVLEPASALVDVNLGLGTQRLRAVPQWPLVLTRSGDHSLIVAVANGGLATYDVLTDSVSSVAGIPGVETGDVIFPHWPGVNQTGNALLIGSKLYTRSLLPYQTMAVPCTFAVREALSADGEWAYFAERNGCYDHGYQKVSTATNTVAETVYLPFSPLRMIPLPDNRRLLVAAFQWIGIVDLR